MKLVQHWWIILGLLLCSGIFVLKLSPPVLAVFALQTADPVLVGAGDIAECSSTRDSNTATLLDSIAGTVFTLGDNVYPDGTTTEFTNCYQPTWGRHKARTKPSPGNHDYHTTGAAGYYTYFGAAASPLDSNCTSNCKGYYSYNLGAWHIIVLNSEISMSAGSAQEQWLRTDLAAHTNICTLAYWHKPRFSSGQHGNSTGSQALWQALYDYRADVVLNGHDHTYERFAPQNPSGQSEPTRGIREFVVGTGGRGLYTFSTIQPNSQVRNNTTWGVLKLTLHPQSYDWEFVPVSGQTFRDSGNAACVGPSAATSTPTPTSLPGNTPTPNRTPTPTSVPSADLIFADSFESGNFSAWSANQNDAGDLSVAPAAKLVGNQGMQALVDDNNGIFVTDDRPNAEPRYRARFYLDPNSIAMASQDSHNIFQGYAGTSTQVLRLELRRTTGYMVRISALNDATTWATSSWYTISDAPHSLEIDWRAATASGANNGSLALWIDGQSRTGLTGLDNDTRRIDRVRLGAISAIDTSTRGTYYFDAFESRRTTLIGTAAAGVGAASVAEEIFSNVAATATLPILLAMQTDPNTEQNLSTVVDDLPIDVAFLSDNRTEPVTVAMSTLDVGRLPDGYRLVGGMLEVTFSTLQGEPLTSLATAATVTAQYGALIANPEQPMTLQRWNAGSEQWEMLAATIDTTAQTITTLLEGPALVAVFQPEVEMEPETNTATPIEMIHSIYLPVIQQ